MRWKILSHISNTRKQNACNLTSPPPKKTPNKTGFNLKLVQSEVIRCISVCRHTLPDVEVLYVDILVGGRLPLAPEQKTLLRRGLCSEEEEEEQGKTEEGKGGRRWKNRGGKRTSTSNRMQFLSGTIKLKRTRKKSSHDKCLKSIQT